MISKRACGDKRVRAWPHMSRTSTLVRKLINAPGRRVYASPLYIDCRQVIASQRNDMCQFLPRADAATRGLLDHLVGAQREGSRNIEAQCFGCAEVDEQLKLGRGLNRKLSRFFTAENAVDVTRCASPQINLI